MLAKSTKESANNSKITKACSALVKWILRKLWRQVVCESPRKEAIAALVLTHVPASQKYRGNKIENHSLKVVSVHPLFYVWPIRSQNKDLNRFMTVSLKSTICTRICIDLMWSRRLSKASIKWMTIIRVWSSKSTWIMNSDEKITN